jgi:hypothetical protein
MVNVVDELGRPTNIAYLATKMENPYLKSPGGASIQGLHCQTIPYDNWGKNHGKRSQNP